MVFFVNRLSQMIPLISRIPTKEKLKQEADIAFFKSTILQVVKEKRNRIESGRDYKHCLPFHRYSITENSAVCFCTQKQTLPSFSTDEVVIKNTASISTDEVVIINTAIYFHR